MECRWARRKSFSSCFQLLALLLIVVASSHRVDARNSERYDTAYECEGKTLNIECGEGELIHLIRANYGRYSITICNEHGNTDWSVNCMSTKSFRVLFEKCNRRPRCLVDVQSSIFDDPCPGTRKYMEAHYTCLGKLLARHLKLVKLETPGATRVSNATTPVALVVVDPNLYEELNASTCPAFVRRSAHPASRTCDQKRNCSIVASTSQFGDPCPNTLKYLEAHYQCMSAATTTTTSRPSPPWLITSQPSVWSTAKPTVRPPSIITTPAAPPPPPRIPPTPLVPSTTVPSSSTTSTKTLTDEAADGREPSADNGQGGPAPSETTQISPTTFYSWQTSRRTTVPSTVWPESSSNGQWSDYGRQTCMPVAARNLFWNTTPAGDVAVQTCPGGATGLARWRCVSQGDFAVWYRETPDLSECRSVWLTALESRVLEGDVILSISSELSQVTNNSRTLYGGDMMITTKIVKNMAEKMAQNIRTYFDPKQQEVAVTELLQGVVRTSSNLLDKAQMASWKDLSHQEQMRVATSLLLGLEENAFLLADTLVQENTIVQKGRNIFMSIRVLDARNLDDELEVFPSEKISREWTVSSDRIELTKGALLENSDSGMIRLVFMAFDRLEEILQPHVETSSVVASDESRVRPKNMTRILNSKVISASLGKGRHIQLSEPVRLHLKHLTVENVTNPTCVFWDYVMSAWSEEGCHVHSTNATHTVCECNHLTNFAVLMDVHAVKLDTAHQVALQIITYIGCIVSVICLVLAILTFQLFRGLKSDRTTIHKNLCVCLLIAEVLFVCGIGQTDQSIVCGVVAGLLHFFFLCAFAWMFLEGFQLYVMLIEVFEAEKSRLRWYYLVAYGAPLLVVAISCIADHHSYGTDRYCWLRADNYFIFSFVGPVILVIVANLIFLSMAIYVMCRHANTAISMKSKEHSRLASASGKEENALPNKLQAHLAWLRGAIVLVFLLGLTWTFGLLYLNQESVVMAYIFTVLNSLQGLFIFVFHCVQNEKVRKEYRKFIRRHSWLPKCLRCSKTVSGSSGASTGTSGGGPGPTGGKEFASHNTSSNPSAPTTDSSGLSPHAAGSYLVSGRGWMTNDRPPVVLAAADGAATSREPSLSEAHVVATLPHARQAFPSAPNIPKSATATWGPLNKNLMWKNISFKSCSRDSGHGGSEQEESPRTHNAMTLGHGRTRDRRIGGADGLDVGVRSGGRRAASPYNHTYTEIRDGRGGGGGGGGGGGMGHHHHHGGSNSHGHHVHLPRGLVGEDDPVYEEIERSAGSGGGMVVCGGPGEIQVSDMSDEDGRRQSDMSRQSSRSYGDHRPLIPYSPANDRNLVHYSQSIDRTGIHYNPAEYSPAQDRSGNTCWEKLRRQQARYEMGDPRLHAGYGIPPQDHSRTVAVLDGHTVVCHLQPQSDMYTGRNVPPPSYSEC